MNLIVESKPNQGGILPLGRHLVKIASIEKCLAAKNDDYKDQTAQVKVVFRNEEGQMTHWYNLQGFQVDENGDYETGKNGKRLKDATKTASCMSILGQVANSAGTEKGEKVDFFGLVGSELGIEIIENERGNKRVAYTTPASDAVKADAEESLV